MGNATRYRCVRLNNGQRHTECASHARGRVDGYQSAASADDSRHDRQTESGAWLFEGCGVGRAEELGEEPVLVLRRDPETVVGHPELEPAGAGARAHDDLTAVGAVLDRVGD